VIRKYEGVVSVEEIVKRPKLPHQEGLKSLGICSRYDWRGKCEAHALYSVNRSGPPGEGFWQINRAIQILAIAGGLLMKSKRGQVNRLEHCADPAEATAVKYFGQRRSATGFPVRRDETLPRSVATVGRGSENFRPRCVMRYWKRRDEQLHMGDDIGVS